MISDTNTNKKFFWFFTVLFAASAVRFFAFGIRYFPYLDDYIQYDTYKLYDANYVLTYIGTVFTRPLAAILDYYVWSNIPMPLFLFIMLLFHTGAVYFLYKSFKNINISLGTVFFVLYAFTPVIFEGIYWLSASSRIVSGIFFASLSVFFLTKGKLFFFAFFNLISYGFYEQSMIFSFILAIFFCFKTSKKYSLIPLINALVIAIYYLVFSRFGQFASRGELHFSLRNILRFYHLIEYTDLSTILNFKNILFIVLSLIVSALLLLFGKKSSFNKEKLFLGILIVILPFVPYLFLNASPALRNTVICAIGFGLIFDCIKQTKLHTIAVFLTCAIFFNAQLNMLANQKIVYETDSIILKNLSPYIEENKSYYLIGAKEKYNDFYNLNITSADWALTGAMRSYLSNKNIKLIVPIEDEKEAVNKDFEKLYIDKNFKISIY